MKMKKILGFILLSLIIISGVNAVNFIYEQERVIADRSLDDLGNIQLFDLVGSISNTSGVESIGNTSGDFKYDFVSLKRDTYIFLNNPTINSTINFSYSQVDAEGFLSSITTQELTLEETGNYYFKLEPDFEGESVLFLVEAINSYVTTLNIQESHPKGMNFVFETFIGGMNNIIEINVSIWRLGFYLMIGGLIVTGLMLMVNTALKIFDITEKVRDKKNRVMRRGKGE